MSEYRILEKKSEYTLKSVFKDLQTITVTEVYIPRFIVQKVYQKLANTYTHIEGIILKDVIEDLKEFTSLEEARVYKRDLELDEGIVRE